ncbi:response regulator [Pseudoduganella violacea]|uniref:Two-component system response regulator QseB n=1 Tax=Pseudoduganella violacea TaxID=1715466 RepID=A0A7W5BEB4_9BURK|nr:response regulator [Pseudoduganella violacea]MBB3121398.1 two-component system response regulator QseB [Pseudoduganella violacea]
MKILLVEDDLGLGNGIRNALAEQDMDIVWVRSRQDARQQLAAHGFGLLLLDLALPDGDGLGLLRELRGAQNTLPVLILTARDALHDRLVGLDSGADDYLVKPFALAELQSRIRALARRSYGASSDSLTLRGLHINLSSHRVTMEGKDLDLSRSEYVLLAVLARRCDRVLTRSTLEQELHQAGSASDSNVLDVHISNLRRKLGSGFIRTVRGIGYVVDREPLPASGQRPA